MDDQRVGVIRGYELHEQIGSGSYGAVYRAFQPLVGREVAIKIIHPSYVNQLDFIRRFEAEAHVVAQLEHPYIVPLYDYWRDPDGAYLVMRWLRGGSLHNAILSEGPWPVQRLAPVLDQIGAALTVAHRHGVVHRDLKPANILLDEDGNAYLADFGIAKDFNSVNSIHLTQPGTVVGSPAYISPEHIQNQPVTPQTDIYSMGIMLYEILTGELPFLDLTPVALLYKHLHEPLPPLRERRPDLPEAFNAIVQRATAKRPADRYPDILSLVTQFRHAVAVMTDGKSIERAVGASPTATGTDQKQRTRSPYETSLMYIPAMMDQAPAVVENPYKGLRAFQEADSADFFGREALTQRLLGRLTDRTTLARFLAVVGPSGSGKSSVVRAGVLPALREDALPGSRQWLIVDMFPGATPFHELETALLRVAVKPPPDMLAQLQHDDHGLLRMVQRVLPGGAETDLVLVIDQFEEIFTLVSDEPERARFLGSLLTAVTDPNSRLRVIITLRADFYDRPLLYGAFGELMRLRTEVVLPLAPEELEQAITHPAERAGVRVEPELVAAIVHDVGEQPGALPLLQYALTELFERRQGRTLTLDAYRASGGVLGALARRADSLYGGLSDREKDAARQLFLRLVTLGEGAEDTRRRVSRAELVSIAGAEGALDRVIDVYSKYRLLTHDRDPVTRGPTVEVAHEALIRTWRRLRDWLDASREDLRLQRRLAAAALEWSNAGRDPSFLASGTRLEQLATWVAETRLALNAEEQTFLDASLAERDQRLSREAARAAREARLERRSRNFLRALTAVLLLATLGAFGLTMVALNQRQEAQSNATAAATAQARAETGERRAEENAAAAAAAQAQAQEQALIAKDNAAEAQRLAVLSGAQAALGQGNTDVALSLSIAANQVADPAPQAQIALADAAYEPGTRRQLVGHSGSVQDVAFSPDGKTALSGGTDEAVILWDLETGTAIRHFEGHTDKVLTVALSPDGTRALSGANDDLAILWDVATGREIRRLEGHDGDVLDVAFSPDGATALSASRDTTLILWDLAAGQSLRRFEKHTQQVQDVVFSPDGKTALSSSGDATLILWDVATGQPIRSLERGHTREVFSVAFSPDGATALSGAADNTMMLWDLASGQPIRSFKGHTREVFSVAFSPDGKTALSASRDNRLGLWDVATGQRVRFLSGHGGAVQRAIFSPDGKTILSGSEDTTLRLFDLGYGAEVQRFTGHTERVNVVAVSPDGKTALSGSGDTTVILWDLATGQVLHQFAGHNDAIGAVVYSPDGKRALSGSTDKTIILWDLAERRFIRLLEGHTKEVSGLAYSPDGKTALSGGGDSVMFLWDLETGAQIHTFAGHEEKINSVAYSPDGKRALSASRDSTVILWDLEGRDQIRVLEGHKANVRSAVFSPDGKRALSASEDTTLILWDLESGKPLRTLAGHAAAVWHAVFSPDGKRALSASEDTSMVLWDLESGQELRRFSRHGAAVRSVAFHPSGSMALSGSNDFTMILWRIDTLDELLAWTQANRYVPELSCDQRALYRIEPLCEGEASGAGE